MDAVLQIFHPVLTGSFIRSMDKHKLFCRVRTDATDISSMHVAVANNIKIRPTTTRVGSSLSKITH